MRWLMANIAVIAARLSVRVLTSDWMMGGGERRTVVSNKRRNPKYASQHGYYTFLYIKDRLVIFKTIYCYRYTHFERLWFDLIFLGKPNDRILKFNTARYVQYNKPVTGDRCERVQRLDCIILYRVIHRASSSHFFYEERYFIQNSDF